MEPRPAGQPCTVRFRRCSVSFVSERHFIGGETTRTVDHNDRLRGMKLDVAHPVHGGPAVFRSKSACRGAILQILMKVMPPLLRYHAGSNVVGRRSLVEFVPAGLVEEIVAAGAEEGKSYACNVWMHVEVTRVYSEVEELLLLCEAAAVAPSSGAALRPGAGDACSICMDELGDGVTGLPDCSHSFHRECILEWFDKSPTCPVMSLAAAEIAAFAGRNSSREAAEATGQTVSQVLQIALQVVQEDAPHEPLVQLQYEHLPFW